VQFCAPRGTHQHVSSKALSIKELCVLQVYSSDPWPRSDPSHTIVVAYKGESIGQSG
jgi:hypothetical protein